MKFEKVADKLYEKLEVEEKDGELLYYKPRRVYPALNKDGSINWFNFLTGGSYWKLIGALLFIIIAVGFIWEYHSNIQLGADCISNITKLQINNITPSGLPLPIP